MEKIIYLINHADILKNGYDDYPSSEPSQVKTEKVLLSIKGEEDAKHLSTLSFLRNVTSLYSSHYVRALSSAKYLADKNEVLIHVDARFGERLIGQLGSLDGLDYHKRQEHDFSFRLHGGESYDQVKKRTTLALKEILSQDDASEIAIYSHSITILVLLSAWCEKGFNLDDRLILNFKGEAIVDGAIETPSIYRLTFEEEKIRGIEKIELH